MEVLVTGSGWIGGGRRSIESGILDVTRGATQELLGTIYSLADFPETIFEGLAFALDRRVLTRLIVDDWTRQRAYAKRRLSTLAGVGRRLWVYDFADGASTLHAKVWVADREICLVGSANLSRRAFSGNHELALFGRDARTGEALGAAIDDLLNSGLARAVVTPVES